MSTIDCEVEAALPNVPKSVATAAMTIIAIADATRSSTRLKPRGDDGESLLRADMEWW
jgi:hypothetical protein